MSLIGEKAAKLRDDIVKSYDAFEGTINLYNTVYRKITGKDSQDLNILDQIQKDKTNLQEGVFNIIAVGETNVGKSQFINLLIEEDLLGVDQSTETAVLSVIQAPKVNLRRAIIHFHEKNFLDILEEQMMFLEEDDKKKKFYLKKLIRRFNVDKKLRSYLGKNPIIIPLEGDVEQAKLKLRAYTSAQKEPNYSEAVERVEIFFKSKISGTGINLIDAPGLNDLNPLRSTITEGYLEDASIIIFMISNDGLKDTSYKTFKHIFKNQLADKLVLVVNKIDLSPDPDNFLKVVKRNLQTDILEPYFFEIEETEGKHKVGELKKYASQIIKELNIFPLSALKANECRVERKLNNKFYVDYLKLVNFINSYLESDKFIQERANRYLGKYILKVNDFEEKIENSINGLIENNKDEAFKGIHTIDLLRIRIDQKSPAVFGKFKTSLENRISREIKSLKETYINSTRSDAKAIIDSSDISALLPGKRAKKAKVVMEEKVQPMIRSKAKEFGNTLNTRLTKIANEEKAKLDVDFKEMLSEIKKELQGSDFEFSGSNLSGNFDIKLASGILLELSGATVAYVGPLIVTAAVAAFIASGVGLGAAIISIVAGIFASFGLIKGGGSLLDKGRKWFKDVKEGTALKNKMKEQVNNEVPRIYEKITQNLDEKIIAEEMVKELQSEIIQYFARLKEPLELILQAGGDVNVSNQFSAIKVEIGKVKKILSKLKNDYRIA